MTRAAVAVAAALAALGIAIVPAQATVLVGADLETVVRTARYAVRGHVVDATGRWTADHRTIETLVTLEVDAWLKGGLEGKTVVFTVPGGRLGRYRNIVFGAPTFTPGDRVVVFLDARGPGLPFLVGLSQGLYRVVPAAGGGDVVTPPALVAGTSAARVVRGDPARRPMHVEAFDALVRGFAAEGRP